jgi:hypothetical protein
MPDPTGRWTTRSTWECPVCGTVNPADRECCGNRGNSVRPSFDEPIRPPDPADIIGRSNKPNRESPDR